MGNEEANTGDSWACELVPFGHSAISGRCDPFKDDIRLRSARISDSRPRIPYNLIGPAGSKLKNKAELTGMSAAVRHLIWFQVLIRGTSADSLFILQLQFHL